MFSKIFAVYFVAVLVATNVAASIEPGIYMITNVLSGTWVRAYEPDSPLFVRSTREYPGPFAIFDIQAAEESSGYTIKNIALDNYVSAAKETTGGLLFANGISEPFEIEKDGRGFIIKVVDKDLVWTIDEPVIPIGNVILSPDQGRPTQRFIITPTDSDLVHQTTPSSAKFSVQKPDVENCRSKGGFFQPFEVILQYFPFRR